MIVKHVLKTGEKVDDLTGHVVRAEDAPQAYRIIRKKNAENERNAEK